MKKIKLFATIKKSFIALLLTCPLISQASMRKDHKVANEPKPKIVYMDPLVLPPPAIAVEKRNYVEINIEKTPNKSNNQTHNLFLEILNFSANANQCEPKSPLYHLSPHTPAAKPVVVTVKAFVEKISGVAQLMQEEFPEQLFSVDKQLLKNYKDRLESAMRVIQCLEVHAKKLLMSLPYSAVDLQEIQQQMNDHKQALLVLRARVEVRIYLN